MPSTASTWGPRAAPWSYDLDAFGIAMRSHPGRDAELVKTFRAVSTRLGRRAERARSFRWLDLGSGPGPLASDLLWEARRATRRGRLDATFVDDDRATCDALEARLAGRLPSTTRTDVVCDDVMRFVETADRAGESYDLVTGLHVLYYLPDWPLLLGRLRLLAPEGALFLALKSEDTAYYREMRRVRARLQLRRLTPFFGEDLVRLARHEGLDFQVYDRRSTIDLPADDPTLWRLLTFTWRLPPGVGDAERSRICKTVRALLPEGWSEFHDVHVVMDGERRR